MTRNEQLEAICTVCIKANPHLQCISFLSALLRGMVIGNFGWENPDKNIRFYGEEMGAGMDYMNPWVYYAHRFYDLILTGGDTEKFWEKVLK